jgi:hypothetical protein
VAASSTMGLVPGKAPRMTAPQRVRNSTPSLRKWLAAVVLAVAAPLLTQTGAGQGIGGPGEEHREAACDQLPQPPGNANGILKHCPPTGHSSGVARGDFNGDTIGDLAIGVPGEDRDFTTPTRRTIVDAGAVHILYGTAANGLVTSGSAVPQTQLISQANPSALVFSADRRAETGDRFGTSLASGDFNGDGISDLAVGSVSENVTGTASEGAVEVFLGSGSGLATTSSALFGPSTFAISPDPGSSFAARSLTWGDFNDDDVGDLAVASEFSDPSGRIGVITVLFGVDGVGLTTDGKVQFITPSMSAETHPSVPIILSAGDFDGDGFSDLVAGQPFRDLGNNLQAGLVVVLYGGPGGPRLDRQQVWDEGVANIPSDPAQFEGFGSAVAVGDVNGDTFDDLAIGAPSEVVSGAFVGAVFVIHGTLGTGLTNPATGTLASVMFTQSSISSDPSESGDAFGASLATGLFNADGFKDLAIGVPRENIGTTNDAGLVHVIYGSSAGLSTQVRSVQNITQGGTVGDAIEADDRFGSVLTAWNFGRTSQADLAIGVPLENLGTAANAGLVHVIYGVSTGLTPTGSQVWVQGSGLPETAAADDNFGAALY